MYATAVLVRSTVTSITISSNDIVIITLIYHYMEHLTSPNPNKYVQIDT